MLYSFRLAAAGPASTPPAVGACWTGVGTEDPTGFTMKLVAASEALLLLLLLLEGSFCGSAYDAAAVDDTGRDCNVENQELVMMDVF